MLPRLVTLPKQNSFFLFGPRQTGKTTLLRKVYETTSVMCYDLLKTDTYMRLSARPMVLREEVLNRPSSITHVVVDEIQKIPVLLDEVHYLMESANAPIFILTGSSARKLKRAGANMLGGRAWTIHLHPMTYLEIKEQFFLNRALRFGTLPKVWLSDDDTANQLLRSYVETYLKEEIEAEALVRSAGNFIRFLYQAGHESGHILNYTTVARDVGTSSKTVKEYFQILEDTLIGRFLLAYAKSKRRRLATHLKFYLFDTGVQRALTKRLNVPIEPGSSDYGDAFEHFIINECWRLNDYFNLDLEFSFYRTEHGAEVDLIIETPRGQCFAIEIKSTDQPRMADVRSGLESFKEIRPHAHLMCVCTVPHRRNIEGVEFLPWQDFLNDFIKLA